MSCLNLGFLPVEPPHLVSCSTDNETSHRGSGRVVSEHSSDGTTIAYRGTGRYPETYGLQVAHRGSGRIGDQTETQDKVSYRGTGRISPEEMRSLVITS